MDTLETDHAFTALRQGLPFLRSGGAGEIFSVNASFEELLGYSEYELKRKGWKAISVQNEDFDADMAITAELVTGKRQSMTVIKSYVSKLGVPIPGQLLAIRYPQGTEPMQCALCFFVPLANGSKAALSLVVDYIEKHTNASHSLAEKIATMAQDVATRKSMTVGERLWDTFGEWALQNPKVATVVFLVLLSLNPFPIVVTYVTRMGWLPAQPVQLEIQDKQGLTRPASKNDLKEMGLINEQQATQIASATIDSERTITTPGGNTLAWVSFRSTAGHRTMSRIGSGSGRSDSRQGGDESSRRRSGSGSAGESGSADSMFGSTALKNRL
jgi:hypothetical protein